MEISNPSSKAEIVGQEEKMQQQQQRMKLKNFGDQYERTLKQHIEQPSKENIQWAVFMGLEHERVHFETSSVLIRQMPLELVRKPEGWKYGPVTTGV